jgi:hypothetical protein
MFRNLINIPLLGVLLSILPDNWLARGRSIHTIYLNFSREMEEKENRENQQMISTCAGFFEEDYNTAEIDLDSWIGNRN